MENGIPILFILLIFVDFGNIKNARKERNEFSDAIFSI